MKPHPDRAEIRCPNPNCNRLQGTVPRVELAALPQGVSFTETRTCAGAMKSRCDQELLVTYSCEGVKVESRKLKPKTQAQAQALARTQTTAVHKAAH